VAGATQAPVAGATATVIAKAIGSQTVLVAGSNGMTVYTFTNDTSGSGKSACSGGCLTKWPALTVAAGTAPTAGDGVTGALATITRADDGTLQVTYNGLPLYFFSGDKAPGDTNGSYPNWNLVKP
jgi:predicted lipoprotein with Yx(FWY)xxD motif